MVHATTREFLASASLLKRVRMMARFIKEKHRVEFENYWEEKWDGKATSDETLAFFSDNSFPSTYYLTRVEP